MKDLLSNDEVARVSHDMRTPLNGIIGMLTMLVDTELTEEQRSFAKTALSCSRALNRSIDDLLGTTRVVTIPESFSSVSNDGMKVLVAEDNEVNQQVMKLLLERLGYQPTVVSNGLAALEAIQNDDYIGVLMDCQMPTMDGFEATRHIRKLDSEKATLPIVAVTAAAIDSEIEKCLDAGMDSVMAKPIHFAELEALLDRWAFANVN